MQIRSFLAAALGVSLLLAGAARADDKAKSADVVPDKIPFDIPYGAPISLEMAKGAIDSAIVEARKRGWKMDAAVVDPSGNLVAFERMDGAQNGSIVIAEHKARTAALFRRETKVFELAVQGGAVGALSLDGVIASRGGIPLIVDGKIIGAIGCSGGVNTQDEATCQAGAATIE